ncbi:MAG: dethiobiotin synthase [Thermodesulfobacteria bacterium]|nr:dethiobiotin synthase [Thermodesulfobacteriota bacterium]
MKIFIAGTDTDVGKTYITAALTAILLKKGLHVGVIKWVSTGKADSSPDIEFILEKAGLAPLGPGSKLSVACPFCFSFPASPHLASSMENRVVEPDVIIRETQRLEEACDILLIEGVGGLMVPLRADLLLIDLMAQVPCPVVLVARSGLGTINHSLLSVEALRQRRLEPLGIVLNSVGYGGCADNTHEEIVSDNASIISSLSGSRVYGPVPFGLEPTDEKVSEILTPLVTNIMETKGHESTR